MSFNNSQCISDEAIQKMNTAKTELTEYMNTFCELYVPALKKWCLNNNCTVSDINFKFYVKNETSFFFPPIMVNNKDQHKKDIFIYALPFENGDNYPAEAYGADIYMLCQKYPALTSVAKETFFEYITNYEGKKNTDCVSKDKTKLRLIGFFKEISYLGDNYKYESIYSYMHNKESEDENLICQYLDEGLILIPSGEIVKDVVSSEHEKIGQLNFLTDGNFMWPSDLSYYVKKYHLRLSDDIIQVMKESSWHVKLQMIDYSSIDFEDYV